MNILNHVIKIFSLCAPKAERKCSELLPLSFGSEGVQGRMCGPRNIHIHPMEGCLKFREGGTFKTKILNPLSPSIHIQILQTDLHTFPLRIS